MNTVQKSSASDANGLAQKKRDLCWMADLKASRDLSDAEKERHGFVIAWFEKWRLGKALGPNREAALRFWKEQVLVKGRPTWQKEQWGEGIRWFLHWLTLVESKGGTATTLCERMRDATRSAGARRGLALRTRKTYSGWVCRFGVWAGARDRVLDQVQGQAPPGMTACDCVTK